MLLRAAKEHQQPPEVKGSWPFQHFDFRFLDLQTMKEQFCVDLSHSVMVICYSSSRQQIHQFCDSNPGSLLVAP